MTRERLEAELARALAATSLPEERAAAIREALRTTDTRAQAGGWRWMAPLAAALLLVPAVLTWRAVRAPRLEVVPPGRPPSPFERRGIDLHERGPAGDGVRLATSSAAEARAWGLRQAGVDLDLPAVRPAEDEGRFELRGVQTIRYRGEPAVAAWYTVDARPVTLLVARAQHVPDRAPAWTLAGKRVRSQAAAGHKLLSWTNAGQTYVLVSDLPADGRRACSVCHTQPARRALIDGLTP
jgi:hypothetical protein